MDLWTPGFSFARPNSGKLFVKWIREWKLYLSPSLSFSVPPSICTPNKPFKIVFRFLMALIYSPCTFCCNLKFRVFSNNSYPTIQFKNPWFICWCHVIICDTFVNFHPPKFPSDSWMPVASLLPWARCSFLNGLLYQVAIITMSSWLLLMKIFHFFKFQAVFNPWFS